MPGLKTVILDYSGTLSFDSIEFGKSDRLEKELAGSGLAELGVTGADFFWNELVNPTWQEGSTTPIAYRNLLEKRLNRLSGRRFDPFRQEALNQALIRFTSRYFEACRIDCRWERLLHLFAGDSALTVIIATDHYMDATRVIIGELSRIGITGLPIAEAGRAACEHTFYAANSADVGFHKSDRRFWEAVVAKLPRLKGSRVLLVDDFGFNEAPGSAYGLSHQIIRRTEETVAVLEAVFDSAVTVCPFLIQSDIAEKKTNSVREVLHTFTVEELIERVEELYRIDRE